jgi:hypothetical protein
MIETKKKERYPIVWININDLDYYWGHVKIRSSDYKNYLMQVAQEKELADGTAQGELLQVYKSIKKKGVINPLIVTHQYGRFFVVVGCQRLACLRVLRWKKLIPCRISPSFDEQAVLDVHPYKSVK